MSVKLYNNFENLFEVVGRDFNTFKKNLMKVDFPCQEIAYGVKSSGVYYAILRLDRPVTQKTKPKKEANSRVEVVGKTKTVSA